jgi:hypothetical protein
LHFGGDVSPGSIGIYGFPHIVVDGATPKRAVEFQYSDESDGVDHATGCSYPFYPIPTEAIAQPHWIEGGEPGSVDRRSVSDRHMLIVDHDHRHLYELFNVYYDGTRWHAGSGAFFDMNTNARQPEGWTSADAAGLAILPGLVRYDEVFGAEEIFRAMQRFGLIVADNGSDMFISGAYDTRWHNGILNPAFRSLTASDFEVITLGWRPQGPSAPLNLHVVPGW